MWLDTPEAVAFCRGMAENPNDRLLRLVYADYLDERARGPADAAHAAFTRLQCDASEVADSAERRKVEAEYLALFAEHWLEWWRGTCRVAGLPAPRPQRGWLGGLFGRVTGRAASADAPYEGVHSEYLEREHLLESCPVVKPEVRFDGSGIVPDGTAVHALYAWGQPDTLSVYPATVGGAVGVPREFLVQWASRLPLRRVNLYFASPSAEGFLPGDLPAVTTLDLQRCETRTVEAVLQPGVLAAVRAIKLHPRLRGGHAGRQTAALLASGHAANCHTLALGLNDPGQTAPLRQIGSMSNLERLIVYLPDALPHAALNRPYPTEDFQMFARLLNALADTGLPPVLTHLTVAFPGSPANTFTRNYPEIDAAIGQLWAGVRGRPGALLTIFHPVSYMTENLPASTDGNTSVGHRPTTFRLY